VAPSSAPSANAKDLEAARVEGQAKSSDQLAKQDVKRAGSTTASLESVQSSASAATVSEAAKLSTKTAQKSKASTGAASNTVDRSTGGIIVASGFTGVPVEWRVASGQVESSADNGGSWQERTPTTGVVWTTVAASGQQIWAGGKAGALYVSRNGGQSWTKISLTGDDVVPLGDVSAIRLVSPGVINVSLTPGGTWQSIDDGKNFRLLPYKL